MNPTELAFQKGYRCTPDGRVISHKGKVLKLYTRANAGYPSFGVGCGDGMRITVFAHRLQGFQKFGAVILGRGIEVRHLDGNPKNFSDANIAIGTKAENESDKTIESKRRGGIAARKHDHAAIIRHYHEFGFANTTKSLGISDAALGFILRKSVTAKQLEAA